MFVAFFNISMLGWRRLIDRQSLTGGIASGSVTKRSTKMSSTETKRNMARAGTMQVTSKEGMSYLKKNLPAHWKHINQLKVHFEENETNAQQGTSATGKKRPAANSSSSNADSKKKNQPPAKKPRLTKTRTMAATAQEGALLLGNQVLGDTRQMTKKKTKAANSKKRQMKSTKAKKTVGKSVKTKTKKRAAPKKKSPLKKANTMVKTAKEGNAFLAKDGTKLPQKRRGQTS